MMQPSSLKGFASCCAGAQWDQQHLHTWMASPASAECWEAENASHSKELKKQPRKEKGMQPDSGAVPLQYPQ